MHRVSMVALATAAALTAPALGDEESVTHDPAALLPPPPAYEGLRVDRAYQATDTHKTIGTADAWSNLTIPDGTAVDPQSARVAGEIAAFAAARCAGCATNTWVNVSAYTPQIHRVPADQPLRPVRWCRTYSAGVCGQPSWGSSLRRMLAGLANDDVTDLHGGVAIPDDVESGAPGTDGEIVIYQPDWVGTASKKRGVARGRMWELWKLRLNPDFNAGAPESATNPKFMASSASRVAGMNFSRNRSADWLDPYTYNGAGVPGAPDSERQEVGWRVTGSGIHFISVLISDEDCAVGEIRHALGLELPSTRYGVRWPATTSDGSNPSLTVTEGMRLRIPRSEPMPEGLTRFGQLYFRAAQEYGVVIDDQTASTVASRVQLNAPRCRELFDGRPLHKQLDRIPWARMVLLKPGSDAQPNPQQ